MPSSTSFARLLRRVRRRVSIGVFLAEFALWGALALFAAGLVILLGRSLGDLPRESWLWAFVLLAPVPFLAWSRTAPRRWSDVDAAAWMDVHAGGTGVLVARAERADESWQAACAERLRRAPDPPRPRLGPLLGRLAPAVLFAGAATWIELPEPAPSGPPVSLFESLIAGLAGRLGHLQDELELDESVAQDLTAQLARLGRDLENASPEALFAAIDQFDERLGAEAGFAREAARSVLQSLATRAGDPNGLADAFRNAVGELGESGFGRDLAPELLERLGGAEALLGGAMGSELGELGPMAEWLRGRLEDKVANLAAHQLVDAPLELPGDWSALFDAAAGALPGWMTGGEAGPGGGATPLVRDEEAPELAERFAPRSLPPGDFADPEHSGVLAVGAAEPTPEEEVRGEWAGLQEVRASTGGTAWRRRLTPAHRRAVQSFFTRGED